MDNKIRADFDIIVDSFATDIEIGQITRMPLITIYGNTRDYPGKYVARLFDIGSGEVNATRYIMISDSLEEIRQHLPFGMIKSNPHETDDQVIIEAWFR